MRRRILIGVAVAYVAALLLAPVLQLLWNAFGTGLGPFLTAVRAPDVRHALLMTLYMTVFAVVLSRTFDTVVDEGLRAYMLRIYNYMVLGLVITGVLVRVTTGRRSSVRMRSRWCTSIRLAFRA